MTDEPAPARTVREFARAAGLSDDSVRRHFEAGGLRLDGEPVTDLDAVVPDGGRVHVAGT